MSEKLNITSIESKFLKIRFEFFFNLFFHIETDFECCGSVFHIILTKNIKFSLFLNLTKFGCCLQQFKVILLDINPRSSSENV